MAEFDIQMHDAQAREHAAWLDVVEELRARGCGDINEGGEDESLHNSIVKWGEELANLRFIDPNDQHRLSALQEKRELYEGVKYRDMIGGA